ncbi:hypothetical protein RB595_010218 [Gaeumannomyces hyphopodioides]
MADSSVLSIAIVGAGITGLTAAIALKNRPGIDVQIYERAQELRDVGATIALGPNGLRTLERLGVHNALDDSIAFRNKSGHPMIFKHAKTNETISVDTHASHVEPRHRTARFYRPHLQQALLQHVDPARLHLRKTLASIGTDPATSRQILTFADGTSAAADIVLGADGIHSPVRQVFAPGTRARWTGWVAFRSVFPRSHVAHLPDLPDEAVHVWGPDRTLFLSPLPAGPAAGAEPLFAVVASAQEDPDAPGAPYGDVTWNSDGDVAVLRAFYRDWHPALRAVVDATPFTRVYPNAAADGLDSWVLGDAGRVTVAGDAAHAHGGAFAAGGSLGIDDAWAFAQSVMHFFPRRGSAGGAVPPADLGSSQGANVTAALRLYERTRKAHTDRVQRTVRDKNDGVLRRLRAGAEETDEAMRRRLTSREDLAWIHEHDVVAAFAGAVAAVGTRGVAQAENQARL